MVCHPLLFSPCQLGFPVPPTSVPFHSIPIFMSCPICFPHNVQSWFPLRHCHCTPTPFLPFIPSLPSLPFLGCLAVLLSLPSILAFCWWGPLPLSDSAKKWGWERDGRGGGSGGDFSSKIVWAGGGSVGGFFLRNGLGGFWRRIFLEEWSGGIFSKKSPTNLYLGSFS